MNIIKCLLVFYNYFKLILLCALIGILQKFFDDNILKSFWLYNKMLNMLKNEIEKHGIFAIKISQQVSNRNDLLGKSVCDMMSSFNENCKIDDFEYIKNVLHEEIPNYKSVITFQNNNHKPFASGSISQLYRIKYHDIDAVLKVKHSTYRNLDQNNIKQQLESIKIIFWLFGFFSKSALFLMDLDFVSKQIIVQFDLHNESKNLTNFNENYKDSRLIIAPKLLANTDSIIIMTYEKGVPLEECSELDMYHLAGTVISLMFKMVFVDKKLHCDLHSGNIKFDPISKKIILYDFGLMMDIDDSSLLFLEMLMGEEPSKILDQMIIADLISLRYPNSKEKVKNALIVCDEYYHKESQFVYIDKLIENLTNNEAVVSSKFLLLLLSIGARRSHQDTKIYELYSAENDTFALWFIHMIYQNRQFCAIYPDLNKLCEFYDRYIKEYNVEAKLQKYYYDYYNTIRS